MTLPAVEEQLKNHLGHRYSVWDWQPAWALDAVMNAEGDIVKAQEAVATLSSTTQLPRLTIRLPRPQLQHNRSEPYIIQAEKDLQDRSVDELVKRNDLRIPRREVINLCASLERACTRYGDLDSSPKLDSYFTVNTKLVVDDAEYL
jgi:hypothetical protein